MSRPSLHNDEMMRFHKKFNVVEKKSIRHIESAGVYHSECDVFISLN